MTDPENDCMHGRFQGIGCVPCEASRRFVAALVTVLLLVAVLIALRRFGS
jgi:hypothetical protein